MMRRSLRLLRYFLVVMVIAELIHLLILVFPQIFFRHRISYGNVHFYRDRPFEREQFEIFQQTTDQIAQSPLYDATRHHRVFLCTSPSRYAFFGLLAARNSASQGFTVEPTGNVFVSEPFIEAIRSRYGSPFRYTLLEGRLSHIITHEIIHTMTTHKLGYWSSRTLPVWKREGYAEYGASKARRASNAQFDLSDQIDHFFFQRGLSPLRLQYLRSQLLIHYLIEVEAMSFDSLMSETVTEADVSRRMMAWKNENPAGF